MKHFNLLKTLLLLCALIVGSLSSWADTTVSMTSFTAISGYVGGDSNISYAAAKGSAGTAPAVNSNQIRVYQNGGTFTITANNDVKIKSVTLGSAMGTTVTYSVDGGTASENKTLAANKTITVGDLDCSSVLFTCKGTSSSTRLYVNSLSVTYSTIAPAYAISAASNNNSWGTVSLSGSVITATPAEGYTYANPAYSVNPANSATVTQDGNKFTVTPSADTEVTINFEALPKYTVTFSDGGFVTQASYGAKVALPTRADISSYAFAGWSETNIPDETTTTPTIIPVGDYTPTTDITLYPVYSKTEGASGVQNKTASVTISDYATANNWTNSTKYTSVTLDENVTVTASGGGNTGKYYTNGYDWRFYQNETAKAIINLSDGNLTSATFTYGISNGGVLKYNDSNLSSGKSVDLSGSSAEFTVGNTSSATNGQVKFTAITVNYTIGNQGTTYYWSAPVAATVERPEITLTANPFTFSTTATITCATNGADIKYSYDGENWSDYSAPLTITETKTIYAKAVLNSDESQVASVKATKNLVEPTVTIDATSITNTNVFAGTDAGSLSASVTYNQVAVEGAAVTWSGNNDAVATINASTGAVTLVGAGSVTFTATYAGNGDYSEKAATYNMTVINNDPNAPGTENNPYTVTQARAAIDAGEGITGVYVAGIVCEGGASLSSGALNYWISDDGTETDKFEIYRGKGLNGANFTSVNDVKIGDVVVVYGDIKLYGSTYEFNTGSRIITHKAKVLNPTFSPVAGVVAAGTTVTINTTTESATIYYTTDGTNPTTESSVYSAPITINSATTIKAFAVKNGFPNSDIVEASYTIATPVATPTFSLAEGTYTSIQTVTISTDTEGADIYYTIDGSEPTTSSNKYSKPISVDETMTIKAIAVKDGMANSTVASATYTINLPDYAELPFSFNSGKDDITSIIGLTQSGLGSDYNTSPKLKFDGTGDYLVLKINEIPGILSFDIKGNSFSGGTFKVQTSVDGENYSDLSAYSDLGDTQSEKFDLSADIRYIKWIYTSKSSGNVGIGNIVLTNTKEITISSAGWATYCPSAPLDFTNVTTLTAYTATRDGNVVKFNKVTGKVPANTGLLVRGETANVPVCASAEAVSNLLFGVTTDTPKDAGTIFVLMKGSKGIGFYKNTNAFTLRANSAYLPAEAVPTADARAFIALDDEATGIADVKAVKEDAEGMFDLQGRKIAKPTKGLYIVNGKKVVVK